MRGVGGVCEMYMCLVRGVRRLGLGFTHPVGTGGVVDVCLCFFQWCGVGDVGGE